MATRYSDTNHRAAVRRGLDGLKPPLAAFASRAIAKALPGKSIVVDGDIPSIIKVILDHWDLAFVNVLPRVFRTYLHEIREVRNQWAHDHDFTEDEARRALETMQLVVKMTGAGPVQMASAAVSASTPRVRHAAPSPASASARPTRGGDADRFNEMLRRFVDAANGGQTVIASYSWIYGRLNGGVPKPWSQAYGNQVSRQAAMTTPLEVKGLGPVALDTFIVGMQTRTPSNGYWPKAGHSRETWARVLGRAVLLHGDAKAPWE